MATSKSKPKSRSSKSGGGTHLLLGVVLGLAIAAAGYLLYTHTYAIQNFFAHSVNTATPHASKATRRLVAGMATAAKDAPFAASEDVFEAGAHLYVANCARCHGSPKHDARAGQSMHPPATQFWNARQEDTLSHQTAHDVYAVIAEGDIPRDMPAYGNQLSETEIWQITLLLRSSRLEMPIPVMHILATSTSK